MEASGKTYFNDYYFDACGDHLVLTHIVGADEESLKKISERVSAHFKGKFVLGKDLMRF